MTGILRPKESQPYSGIRRFVLSFLNAVILISIALQAGCAHFRRNAIEEQPGKVIPLVEWQGPSEMESFTARIPTIVHDAYPKIVALLGTRASGQGKFKVTFDKTLSVNDVPVPGYTLFHPFSPPVIHINTSWMACSPASFEPLLVHEMTHLVQNYQKGKVPAYWTEGIADYVCFKLGYTNETCQPACSADYPHFTAGYRCAGAFLLRLDDRYGIQVIRRLHNAMQNAKYKDAIFSESTGRSLTELWDEFQKTGAYPNEAAVAHGIKNKLGFVDGPPPDLARRAATYLKEAPGGAITLRAGEFLLGLAHKNALPGFSVQTGAVSRGFELGIRPVELATESDSSKYPAVRTFYLEPQGEPCRYHYRVQKNSERETWKIVRAWRTTPHGATIEEYPVP